MPRNVKSKAGPNKIIGQASGAAGSPAGKFGSGEENPDIQAEAAAEEENGLGITVQEEELEIPVSSYFRFIIKSLVKLLEISAATIITMVVAFTTKYSEVGMIFENAEKVEAILDDEAKKEILINNVVGTTFQAVRKISNLKGVSDSKSSALQKFINVDIPEERLRALAGSMGNQLTRNDLLNFKAVYDSLYDDQTVPKISFANVLTLSPSGILFSEGIRTEHRTMEVKTPITPTSIVKKGGKVGEASTEEFDPALQPLFLPFCGKGGNNPDFQCSFSYGSGDVPNYFFRFSETCDLSSGFLSDSLQLLQELNASNLQYYPPESEYYLQVLSASQRKLAQMVLVICEERQRKYIGASVVAERIKLLLNGDENDPRTLPTVDSLIMSNRGSPGMIGTYSLELLWSSGDNRPSRHLNLVVAGFLAYKINITDGIPASFSKFQQECRKVISEIPPSHPWFPKPHQRVEVWMGAVNEAIDACEPFPVQQLAMMELRNTLESAVDKEDPTVADLGNAINEFLKKSSAAQHIGPIQEASVFTARQQTQIAAPSAKIKAPPPQPRQLEAKRSDADSAGLPTSGKGKGKRRQALTGGKSGMPKSLKEYQEMLKNMSPEQRAQFDRTNNENAMVRLNDFFKQNNLDASKYLQKAKTADGSTVCYLKKSTSGTDLVYIEKHIFDRMDQQVRSALRRLSALSRRYHGIVLSKTGPTDSQVKIVMAATTRSSRLTEDPFDELTYFASEFEDNEDTGTATSLTESFQTLELELAEQRRAADQARCDAAEARREAETARREAETAKREARQLQLDEAAKQQELRAAASADYEQKLHLAKKQQRLELERVRLEEQRKAQTSGQAFIASVPSYPPQAPPPPSFMPTFGWGQFGPSPEQSGGPLQSRHGAEAAYWANATGGYMPPYAYGGGGGYVGGYGSGSGGGHGGGGHPPHFMYPQLPVTGQTHGQTGSDQFSNLGDSSDLNFDNLEEVDDDPGDE